MPQRELTKTEVAENFVMHTDVISATKSWALGLLSDQELVDVFKYALMVLESAPEEFEYESGLER